MNPVYIALISVCLGLLTIAVIFIIFSTISFSSKINDVFNKLTTSLIDNNRKIEKIAKTAFELTNINIGDKVMYPQFPLTWTDTKENFWVDFECDVLEVTENKVKVKSYSGSTSNDRWNKLTQPEQQRTLRHLDEKWVDKKNVELILDSSKIRDIKLDKLLEE